MQKEVWALVKFEKKICIHRTCEKNRFLILNFNAGFFQIGNEGPTGQGLRF